MVNVLGKVRMYVLDGGVEHTSNMNPYRRGLDEFPPSVVTCKETAFTCWTNENNRGRAPRHERVEQATIVSDISSSGHEIKPLTMANSSWEDKMAFI